MTLIIIAMAAISPALASTGANEPVRIIVECNLSRVDNRAHKLLFGFGETDISKAQPRSARILDPDQLLAGKPMLSVNIDETMRPGSRYAITFGSSPNEVVALALQAIEIGAFEATLSPPRGDASPSLAGRCFMVGGEFAEYVYKRRQRGEWGTK